MKCIIIFFLLIGCSSKTKHSSLLKDHQQARLKTNTGIYLNTFLAITIDQRLNGLSYIKSNEFNENDAMLFLFDKRQQMAFWMPNTFFDLDVFFLDKNFKVIDIDRDVPHFKNNSPYKNIPIVKKVWANYVLEMKASSVYAKKINIGDKITF